MLITEYKLNMHSLIQSRYAQPRSAYLLRRLLRPTLLLLVVGGAGSRGGEQTFVNAMNSNSTDLVSVKAKQQSNY